MGPSSSGRRSSGPTGLAWPPLRLLWRVRPAAAAARALRTLPSGWRNNPLDEPQPTTFTAGDEELRVGYRFARDGSVGRLSVGEDQLAGARLHACTRELVDLEVEACAAATG